ncbi:MAG: CoA transferase [Myxococcales bacterium]|nr:CoA transferase [Myxococcales bacterium]
MPALDGLRILDLSRVLAGPYCTAILADHGAEVWKIENPAGGDDTRAFGPPFARNGLSTYFCAINRNKKSLAIDLKTPQGVELVRALAAKADVVVENFRPGTAERLGLGATALRAVDPRLIYCSLSGFGQTGPWRDKPGYDLAVQGLSGLQALTGAADGPPTKVGTSIADLVTGLHAVQGILLALHRRERTGLGDTVDVAMLDSVVALLTYQATGWLLAGNAPSRLGNRHPSIVPYETFACQDGHLNLAVGNDALFAKFAALVGHAEWSNDPRFARNPARVAHRDELVPAIAELLAADTVANWTERLGDAGIPCGPIFEVPAVLSHPQTIARGMVTAVDDGDGGSLDLPGVPIHLVDAPGSVRTPPPQLGADTRTVLAAELGLDSRALDDLLRDGVIAGM